MVNLTHRDAILRERMDADDCDPVRLRRTYRRFRLVNRLFAGWRRTYVGHVRPYALARRRDSIRILDVGCGGGDVTHALARWLARDGLRAEVTGVDPDPVAITEAQDAAARRRSRVRFVRGTTADLDGTFDVVISNHVLHHIEDLPAFLDDTAHSCAPGGLIVHSDIERSVFAYAAFAVLAAPLTPGTFVREDGLRSIRRSYTATELQVMLPAPWHVLRQAPSRVLVSRVVPRA